MQNDKPKPDEITGPPDKTIWREGEGQVRQWFDAANNVMHEQVAKFSFDPARPAKLSPARRNKYEHWQWLFPPTDIKWQVPLVKPDFSTVEEVVEDDLSLKLRPAKAAPSSSELPAEERMTPEWVFVAFAELQGMYCPKLWARFQTSREFTKDPEQIGLYCGYKLGQSVHALGGLPQLALGIHHRMKESAAPHEHVKSPPRKEEELHQSLEAQRRGTAAHFFKLALSCTDLDYLRKLADAFAEALHHKPFLPESGRPAQRKRHSRFEVLRLLVDDWQEVEDGFVKKRKKRRDLHEWLKARVRSYKVGLNATENLCDDIGLQLRPHKN